MHIPHPRQLLRALQRRSHTLPGVQLGLQGGGAHGAFTWGVLDALLQDGRLAVAGVSGTSAGAMNAVALAHGLMVGGTEGARQALDQFWSAVATSAPFEMASLSSNGDRVVLPPAVRLMLQWSRLLAPEQFNPFGANPLRDILETQVDFERLRRHCPVPLFVAATHAQTGQVRLFREFELGVDAVLASACLPQLHHTVLVDGQPYWDGGYAANPPVWPLLDDPVHRDVLLVLLSPLMHADTPTSVSGIRHRTLEFAFNSAFLSEMRLLGQCQAQAQAQAGWLPRGPLAHKLAGARFHVLAASEQLTALGQDSKLVATLPIFKHMKSLGREHALAWLDQHAASVGQRSTVDLARVFGAY
ncbi:MAG: patatin-like phospholipase family protein [Hydrogenophaga sp.]|jgi:NTE family protein|uniref:patatin-like phospholipase family protein n=1 Tax=Hydrogenophaga sp. TaxID=1904254 RepID=UPI0027170F64|nr:patatin-like phospholipase family protein [Hydrogenophaga sp.]MDO9568802.1 patatin-like phospholipase family protein [Hydrogenophaga sp.]MDP2092497.1 patatin-like phospholipase family protein [Hydrogenophaga sp.]MDP2221048.1 patatin-like phospholipase family protein [Hydrogenophaga sp.]MDP3376520.1 patatin-like phospholipase family protein [Hydrogenophaga sp.]MDP3922152.1 patatin-like phospholipase family protein [Hydrogenophaga sp.]